MAFMAYSIHILPIIFYRNNFAFNVFSLSWPLFAFRFVRFAFYCFYVFPFVSEILMVANHSYHSSCCFFALLPWEVSGKITSEGTFINNVNTLMGGGGAGDGGSGPWLEDRAGEGEEL